MLTGNYTSASQGILNLLYTRKKMTVDGLKIHNLFKKGTLFIL